MPRTEVYQLRLTKDEKDALASEAKRRDISIALLMRRRIGLDSIYEPPPKVALVAREVESPEPPTAVIIGTIEKSDYNRVTKRYEDQGYTKEDAEKKARDELVKEAEAKAEVVDPKRFKQLVAQLQSRMSLEDAEDEARKRLGMES